MHVCGTSLANIGGVSLVLTTLSLPLLGTIQIRLFRVSMGLFFFFFPTKSASISEIIKLRY